MTPDDETADAGPIRNAIDAQPLPLRKRLTELKRLIETTAQSHPDIGPLSASLKWGQPSFVPARKGIGSSVRIGVNRDGHPCLYFICHTQLVDRFREIYGNVLRFEGNRAIRVSVGGPLPETELRHCVAMAFTYLNRGGVARKKEF